MLEKRVRKRFLSKYGGKKYGWFLMTRDFVLMLAGVSLLFSLLVGVSRVDGASIEPTLRNGRVVFFTRVNGSYSRGDVVYARMPSGRNYVKRVVALVGDVVELRDGVLYVNGVREDASGFGQPPRAALWSTPTPWGRIWCSCWGTTGRAAWIPAASARCRRPVSAGKLSE